MANLHLAVDLEAIALGNRERLRRLANMFNIDGFRRLVASNAQKHSRGAPNDGQD